jgi:hypothetical protein
MAAKHNAESGNRRRCGDPALPKAGILETRQSRRYPDQDYGQSDIRVSFADSPQFVQPEREPLDLLRQGIFALRHIELFLIGLFPQWWSRTVSRFILERERSKQLFTPWRSMITALSCVRRDMEHYHRVSSILREIKKRIPIDLIVHTKSMHEKFIRQVSAFAGEIAERGRGFI